MSERLKKPQWGVSCKDWAVCVYIKIYFQSSAIEVTRRLSEWNLLTVPKTVHLSTERAILTDHQLIGMNLQSWDSAIGICYNQLALLQVHSAILKFRWNLEANNGAKLNAELDSGIQNQLMWILKAWNHLWWYISVTTDIHFLYN